MAEQAGVRVLTARATELESSFAFGVVRQLFEAAVASDGAVLLSGAAGQVAYLTSPNGARTDDASRATGEMAILHGLYWLTVNACEQGPLLLTVDDLHLVDPPSLRFLSYLLPRLDGLPLIVAVAARPGELDTPLLRRVVGDPNSMSLRPPPLSDEATAELVARSVDGPVDPAFHAACHRATGGNPLILRELLRVLISEKVPPTAANADRIFDLGPGALSYYIDVMLGQLPPAAAALARAVAVLGDGCRPHWAMCLADQRSGVGEDSLRILERAGVLVRSYRSERVAIGPDESTVAFVLPLVRTAVYDAMDAQDRVLAHRLAARLMMDEGEPAARAGAHLLRVPPAGDNSVASVLDRAAGEAMAAGSPEIACRFLRRYLAEPPATNDLLDVLVRLGDATFAVDVTAATEYFGRALAATADPLRRAHIAYQDGLALCAVGSTDAAATILISAIGELGDAHIELTRALETVLLMVPLIDPDRQDLNGFLIALGQLPPDNSAGGRMLDSVIARHAANSLDSAEAVARARRALAGEIPSNWRHVELMISAAWSVLLAADLDETMAILDVAVSRAHRHGSQQAAAFAHSYRMLSWLWRGMLDEALADGMAAKEAVDSAGVEAVRPLTAWWLAETLVELGRLVEAEQALAWARLPEPLPRFGGAYQFLAGRSHLRRVRGYHELALADALEVGRRAAAVGLDNPALMPWRSEAALCLRALDRAAEARAYAAVETVQARRWGGPRALGRALRVAGLVESDTGASLRMLAEAVAVLEPSPARLEYAEALIDYGAALRRTGARIEARSCLLQGAKLAQTCGAIPLVELANEELALAGARKVTGPSGPSALTPGELRVAELAATGQTNRTIAQGLFVTPKTVEVHLSNVYRKLGITGRKQIPDVLVAVPAAGS